MWVLRGHWGGLDVDMSSAQWDTHSAAGVGGGGWVRRRGGDDMGRGCDFTIGERRGGAKCKWGWMIVDW